MFFENEDVSYEIAKHMNGLELINFLKVNKNTYELRNNKFIKKTVYDFIDYKIIRIQNRWRKYLDKLDLLSNISEKANISISSLNIMLENEFCLVDKYYRTYEGDIGTLLLTLLTIYQEVLMMRSGNMLSFGENNVTVEEFSTFRNLIDEYIG